MKIVSEIEAIEILEKCNADNECRDCEISENCDGNYICSKALKIAVKVLKEKQERDNMRCENCKNEKIDINNFSCNCCSRTYIEKFQPKEDKK